MRTVAVIGSGSEAWAAIASLAAAGVEVVAIPGETGETPLRKAGDQAVSEAMRLGKVQKAPAAEITGVEGAVGDFRLTVRGEEGTTTYEVGAIVCAMDLVVAPCRAPSGLEGSDRVVALEEIASKAGKDSVCIRLDADEFPRKLDARTAMDAATSHAKAGGKAWVLFRNMPVFSTSGQARYDEARLAGVRFLRTVGGQPTFAPEGGGIRITALDEVLPERPVSFVVDRVAVARAAKPAGSFAMLAALLGQPLDTEGMLQPSNIRHAPLASARRGIFFCGRCHQDTDETESQVEAEALAGQVLAALPAAGTMEVPVEVLSVDISKCASCLTCLRLCPHGAIAMREKGNAQSVTFMDRSCYECGICAAACPREAISHGSTPSGQLRAAIEVAAQPLLGKPSVVVLACSQGAVQAADGAGRLGIELPAEAVIIDVPCAGRVSESLIMDALIAGAGGVVVLGCHEHNCRSLHGSEAAKHRSARVGKTLKTLGLPDCKVRFHSIAANEPARLAGILREAVRECCDASRGVS